MRSGMTAPEACGKYQWKWKMGVLVQHQERPVRSRDMAARVVASPRPLCKQFGKAATNLKLVSLNVRTGFLVRCSS